MYIHVACDKRAIGIKVLVSHISNACILLIVDQKSVECSVQGADMWWITMYA